MGTGPGPTVGTAPAGGTPERHRPHRRRGRLALAAVLAPLLVGVAGCGGDDGSPGTGTGGSVDLGGGGDGGSGEPTITATFDISGDVTLRAKVSDHVPRNQDGSPPASCGEWAKGYRDSDGGLHLKLPTFISQDGIEGHRLILDGEVEDYAGPGTYQRSALAGSGNPIGFVIDDHALAAPEDAQTTVTVGPDGAGEFTFATLKELSTGIADPQEITGKLTWTCTDG